jgi:LuxR family transcriptional regulator, quorum-sensing system regulator CviR
LELGRCISKNDALIMLEIINGCLSCNSEDDYRKLIEEFQKLIFFDYSISALIDLQDISCEKMRSCSINSQYPDEFLETYTANKYQLIDPLYKYFLITKAIQNYRDLINFDRDLSENPAVRLSLDFIFGNTFLYGICSPYIDHFTVFTITGEQIKNEPHTSTIIKYLVPYLSIALKRLISIPINRHLKPLTTNELEVLKWLKEGKTSWETASILNRSERVVKFHIDNILKKLSAMNRTHAVAIALENNLLAM